MRTKAHLSTAEAAEALGISRIAVFKKIQTGVLKAVKIGRNYAVPIREIERITKPSLSPRDKAEIDRAVKKTVREYGETLKLLGNA